MDVQSPLQPDPALAGATPLQALEALNQSVAEALVSCLQGQPQQAAQHLLLALPQLMTALGALGQEAPDTKAVGCPSEANPKRILHIEGNRVEVWVDDQIRSSWSIWSVGDLKEVCRLAEEFDCGLSYSFLGDKSQAQTEMVLLGLGGDFLSNSCA
ncbi:MAG: hypothetical protein Q6K80_11285 [Thermostichus sp. DG_1_6_bins_120]